MNPCFQIVLVDIAVDYRIIKVKRLLVADVDSEPGSIDAVVVDTDRFCYTFIGDGKVEFDPRNRISVLIRDPDVRILVDLRYSLHTKIIILDVDVFQLWAPVWKYNDAPPVRTTLVHITDLGCVKRTVIELAACPVPMIREERHRTFLAFVFSIHDPSPIPNRHHLLTS